MKRKKISRNIHIKFKLHGVFRPRLYSVTVEICCLGILRYQDIHLILTADRHLFPVILAKIKHSFIINFFFSHSYLLDLTPLSYTIFMDFESCVSHHLPSQYQQKIKLERTLKGYSSSRISWVLLHCFLNL